MPTLKFQFATSSANISLLEMWKEFDNDDSQITMEELYNSWQNKCPIELPSFVEFDEQLNNEAATFEKFVEFFTTEDSCSVVIQKRFLSFEGNRQKSPIKAFVIYTVDVTGRVELLCINCRGFEHSVIDWSTRLYEVIAENMVFNHSKFNYAS